MILWDVVFKVEGVEQTLLLIRLKPNHIMAPSYYVMLNYTVRNIKTRESFSTESGHSRHLRL